MALCSDRGKVLDDFLRIFGLASSRFTSKKLKEGQYQ
jgi:hypothetical protein